MEGGSSDSLPYSRSVEEACDYQIREGIPNTIMEISKSPDASVCSIYRR